MVGQEIVFEFNFKRILANFIASLFKFDFIMIQLETLLFDAPFTTDTVFV